MQEHKNGHILRLFAKERLVQKFANQKLLQEDLPALPKLYHTATLSFYFILQYCLLSAQKRAKIRKNAQKCVKMRKNA